MIEIILKVVLIVIQIYVMYKVFSTSGKTLKKKYYISYLVGDINNGIKVKSKLISLDKNVKEKEIKRIEENIKEELNVQEVYILFFTEIK